MLSGREDKIAYSSTVFKSIYSIFYLLVLFLAWKSYPLVAYLLFQGMYDSPVLVNDSIFVNLFVKYNTVSILIEHYWEVSISEVQGAWLSAKKKKKSESAKYDLRECHNIILTVILNV